MRLGAGDSSLPIGGFPGQGREGTLQDSDHSALIVPMLCFEYLRLRLKYGSALRRCGQILLSKTTEPVNFAQQMAAWQNAMGQRDEARERLHTHKMSVLLAAATRNPRAPKTQYGVYQGKMPSVSCRAIAFVTALVFGSGLFYVLRPIIPCCWKNDTPCNFADARPNDP